MNDITRRGQLVEGTTLATVRATGYSAIVIQIPKKTNYCPSVDQTEANVTHLAAHLLSIGRSEAALDVLARASSDEIERTEYWQIRSLALYELGQYEASHESARRGLERHPEDIELLDLYAIAEVQLGFPGKALKALAKALSLSPDNPELLAHRAYAFARRLNFDEAEATIEKALRIAPESQIVLQTRAQIAVQRNDPRAAEYIEGLLQTDPEDRGAHVLRGNLAGKNKRFVSAARAWEQAARLDPGNPHVAAAAREARVHAHPILAPARAMWRFGRWRSYFLYLTVVFALAASGLGSIRVAIIIVWLIIVALSWFGPGLIRRYQNREYGGH